MSERRTWDVHGLVVRVACQSPSQMQRVETVLRPFAVVACAEPAAHINIAYADEPLPPAAESSLRKTWSGVLPSGLSASCYSNNANSLRRFDLHDLATVSTDLVARRAQILLKPSADHCLVFGAFTPTLCHLLAQVGHYVIHSACLVAPDGKAMLLCGQSGAGKTTTTLALALAGWKMLSDDTSFLAVSDSPKLWGLPRPFKVHRNTLDLLPQLTKLPSSPATLADEVAIDFAHLAPPSTRQLPAGAVIFLQKRNAAEHQIAAISPLAAVAQLASQNVRAGDDAAATGPAGQAFAAMTSLVRHTRTLTLSVGPDLSTLPRALEKALESNPCPA